MAVSRIGLQPKQAARLTKGTMSSESVRDVIIVGSGPAGYTAAIYAARADLKPLVFESEIDAGGALMTTTEVENFPGFRDAIMGPELMDNMRAQAERFGAEMITEDVVEMDLTGDIKIVKDGYGNTFSARTVILAMGSGYRKLGLEGEDRLSGHGVSWCATCDGFFFRDKDIAVVGGGDSAVEEATFLTRFAKSVTIVHRRDELRASKIMAARAFKNPKIKFAWNSVVTEIHGDKTLTGDHLEGHHHRCRARAAGFRAVHRHWPRSPIGTGEGPGGSGSRRLRDHRRQVDQNEPARRVRLRGSRGPHVSASSHGRRNRLRGRP